MHNLAWFTAPVFMEDVYKNVAFIAHTCTAILGLLTIWGLIRHRKKIRSFVQLLGHNLVNERIRRIRATITRLDELNHGVKEDRKEIVAILGELAGMIRAFTKHNAEFLQMYEQMIKLTTTNSEGLSEATKRRLAEELNCLLDDQALAAALNLMEDSDGPKTR